MDIREFTEMAMTRTRQATLEMVNGEMADGLTREQLVWQPAAEANPIGFLLFHTFRTEDRYFNRWLARGQEVWERDGWKQRWPLPSPPSNSASIWTVGNSWTAEDVQGWQPPALVELLAYAEAVRTDALSVLQGFDLFRLEEPLRPERPQFTAAYYFQHGSLHEAQHQGQIDYILGLLRERSP